MVMKINLFNYTITIKKKKRKQAKKSYGKFGEHAPVAPDGYRHRWLRQETIKAGAVAPDGYLHRWIRQEGIKASHIKKSVFKLVKAKEYKQSFPTVEKGRFKGCIGLGGLILARIPEEMVEARTV